MMDLQIKNLHTQEEKLAALEAVLFAYGEEMPIGKISSILSIKQDALEELLNLLSKKLEDLDRGIVLVRNKDRVMLATKPYFSELLEEIVKEDLKEDLTPAASETLSLIAYFGPIARSQIDFVRGVNSSFILRNLLMRGLVERKPGRGGAYEYEVSMDFLKHMGIGRVEDLPEYEQYHQLKEKYFEEQGASQQQSNPQPSVL